MLSLPPPSIFQGLEMDRVSHEKLHCTPLSQSWDAYGNLPSRVLRHHLGCRQRSKGKPGSSHLPVTSCCSVPCSLASAGLSQSGESKNMGHRCPESSKVCHHAKNQNDVKMSKKGQTADLRSRWPDTRISGQRHYPLL